jgi:hypothetical protein
MQRKVTLGLAVIADDARCQADKCKRPCGSPLLLRHPVQQQSEKPDPGLDDQPGLRGRGHIPGHGPAPKARLKPVEAGGLQCTELRDLLDLLRVLGYEGTVAQALSAWAGVENYEMRLTDDGLDARVLAALRRATPD